MFDTQVALQDSNPESIVSSMDKAVERLIDDIAKRMQLMKTNLEYEMFLSCYLEALSDKIQSQYHYIQYLTNKKYNSTHKTVMLLNIQRKYMKFQVHNLAKIEDATFEIKDQKTQSVILNLGKN